MIDSGPVMKRDETSPLVTAGRPPLGKMLKAVGFPTRWRILQELEKRPSLNVELSERIGDAPSVISRHLRALREAGMVVVARSGIYSIPPEYVAEPGVLDYGHFVLRVGK